ncbi:hypothetical protein K5X82_15340 [Halosquirtibacter xylanolyticus]|uniref:lysozyme inhibitor LprI family protein n=1 Tax=Halosquirtibacter xylanolyticus TaxID=3374599 RepID=UPI003748A756|nr:hypothetical protein K5X82_15340 [Prolixibacteraceae bacterium]
MKQHRWVVFICVFMVGFTIKAQTQRTEKRELTIENIEFQYSADTAKVNRQYCKDMQAAPSAVMILKAINDAEDSYNNLVNEYFKILFQNLNKDERIMIMNDQRRWKQFIRAQLKLYGTFSKPPYVHKDQNQHHYIYYSKKYLEQTKQRLNTLFSFIRSVYRRNHQDAFQLERECVSPLL